MRRMYTDGTLQGPNRILHLPCLPKEIHLAIKEYIPSWDLRAHASLYLAIPSVYKSTPDEFWKLACWNNGIGVLPEEEENIDKLRWRDIAVECIRRDGFCRHAVCGGRLLAYNRARMMTASNTEFINAYEPAHLRGDGDFPIKLTAHQVFGWIGFRPSHDVQHEWFSVGCDAHLLPLPNRAIHRDEGVVWAGPPDFINPLPGIDVSDKTDREYLMHHPLVARSFATSIPVESISFCYVHNVSLSDAVWAPDIPRAVTVYDVLRVLHDHLDDELNREETKTYVQDHYICLERHNWTILNAFERLHTLRDLFSICPLRELKFIGNGESVGPAFTYEQM